MYETIKSISLSDPCSFKAILFFYTTNITSLELNVCAKLAYAQWENYCSVRGSIYNNHWQLSESIGNKDGRKKLKYLIKFFMTKQLRLTPVWVLEKIPLTRNADGNGNASVYTDDATDANFIQLALDSLHINYETYDYHDDDNDDDNDFLFGFDFRIEDIKEECPSFYQSMKELDNNNLIKKNILNNYGKF